MEGRVKGHVKRRKREVGVAGAWTRKVGEGKGKEKESGAEC